MANARPQSEADGETREQLVPGLDHSGHAIASTAQLELPSREERESEERGKRKREEKERGHVVWGERIERRKGENEGERERGGDKSEGERERPKRIE